MSLTASQPPNFEEQDSAPSLACTVQNACLGSPAYPTLAYSRAAARYPHGVSVRRDVVDLGVEKYGDCSVWAFFVDVSCCVAYNSFDCAELKRSLGRL
jgi:hypothetical protein